MHRPNDRANNPVTEKLRPTRWGAFVFRGKVLLLQARRSFRDLSSGPKIHSPTNWGAAGDHRLTHRSPLWTSDNLAEQSLQQGKVQNLRIAAKRLNGVVIPAGEIFIFWKQIGRATRGRGFVDGREVREGCIIAAVGGGICQMSNALYDLALKGGFEICERHPHTQVVPGSAAEEGRDATVAWNHIDLRFRSLRAYQIEASLTDAELHLSFRFEESVQPATTHKVSALRVVNNPVGSCETCGEDDCFRHDTVAAHQSRTGHHRTAFLLDAVTPEFDLLLREECRTDDCVMIPLRSKVPRYAWHIPPDARVRTATSVALRRTLNSRRSLAPPEQRALQLSGADALSKSYSRRIPADATSLVVDLTLLKELYRQGVLGGRHVTVWINRFPLKLTHELLDAAADRYPDSALLSDFRAEAGDVEDEWAALLLAHRIVTPHPYLARTLPTFTAASIDVPDWVIPLGQPTTAQGYIYFPGPTAVREGAIAVREAARRLTLPVSVGGRLLEEGDFWQGVTVLDPRTHPMCSASVVVCPAAFKNRPFAALQAVGMGKAVIATPECGVLGALEVPFGDADALCGAIEECLSPCAKGGLY